MEKLFGIHYEMHLWRVHMINRNNASIINDKRKKYLRTFKMSLSTVPNLHVLSFCLNVHRSCNSSSMTSRDQNVH